MDHSDVIEPHERAVCTHSKIIVVTRVDGQTFSFHQLPAKLCQIDQNLGAFAVLSQVILPEEHTRQLTREQNESDQSSACLNLFHSSTGVKIKGHIRRKTEVTGDETKAIFSKVTSSKKERFIDRTSNDRHYDCKCVLGTKHVQHLTACACDISQPLCPLHGQHRRQQSTQLGH